MGAEYIYREEIHNTGAARVVVPEILKVVQPRSVLDVGCGIGTWLKVFEEYGVADYLGVDGDYVDDSLLHIQRDKFYAYDLNKPLHLGRSFDLVISLEVAEHLSEYAADTFVKTLVSHGKVIVFSAAIPGQGGQNHLNEQWPAYWQKKFAKHGFFYFDLIRPTIWEDSQVEVWYRQNIFILFHKEIMPNIPYFNNTNLIHPDLWMGVERLRLQVDAWKNGEVGVQNSWRCFRAAMAKKIKKSLKLFGE